MEYSKMVSVSGLPGLFELISSKNDGALLRSVGDKSTRFVSSRKHQFSHLESIEVYTERENVNLAEVFLAMDKSNEKLPDEKDKEGIKKYFEKVYPEMDFDRVYTSDMRKMVKWFDELKKNEIEIRVPEAGEEEEVEEIAATPKAEEAPVVKEKKTTKKSQAATAGTKDDAATEATEKPKKAAKKKKAE